MNAHHYFRCDKPFIIYHQADTHTEQKPNDASVLWKLSNSFHIFCTSFFFHLTHNNKLHKFIWFFNIHSSIDSFSIIIWSSSSPFFPVFFPKFIKHNKKVSTGEEKDNNKKAHWHTRRHKNTSHLQNKIHFIHIVSAEKFRSGDFINVCFF